MGAKEVGFPYMGIVDGKLITHAKLVRDDRKRMKILLIDSVKDVPLKILHSVLNASLKLYK